MRKVLLSIVLVSFFGLIPAGKAFSANSLVLRVRVAPSIEIQSPGVAPNSFSPNGDGTRDTTTISYSLSNAATVTVKILDNSNNLVRVVKNAVSDTQGGNTAVWDGKDESGQVVADGSYKFRIEAAGAVAVEGTVVVDNHWVTLASPAAGLVIQGVTVFDFALSVYGSIRNVSLYYQKKGEATWYTIDSFGCAGAQGHVTVPWDTKAIVNGVYSIRATITSNDLNNIGRSDDIGPFDFTVQNGVTISNVSVAPNSFSPNGDGVRDSTTISYMLTQAGTVTVKILDNANALLRTIKNGVSDSQGNNFAVWDGTNLVGQTVVDGAYKYRIEAVDASGNAATPAEGSVTVDNHFVRLASPAAGSVIQGVTVFDFALSVYGSIRNVSLYYQKKGEATWYTIDSFGCAGAQGHVTVPWDTKAIVNGVYSIRATITSNDLNNIGRGEDFGPWDFTVQNGITISNVSVAPNAFSPNGDGVRDGTTISYMLTTAGTVTVKILDNSNNLIRLIKNGLSEVSGANSAIWNGQDGNGQIVADGAYKYRIEAVDGSGNAAAPAEGSVTVDNHFIRLASPAPGTTLQGVTVFDFIFSGNGSVRQTQLFYQKKDVYGWYPLDPVSGTDAQGHVKISWDTRQVVNGTYTIRATVGGLDLNGAGLGENFAPCDFVVQNGIALSGVSAAPNPFSPNGDGNRDTATISYMLTGAANVTVKIVDDSGSIVRLLKNDVKDVQGNNTAIWDGKNEAGQVMADGAYKYRIEAADDSGNTATPAEGSITVDDHFIRLASPAAGTTLQGVTAFDFTFSGNGSVRQTQLFYQQKNTYVWYAIDPVGGTDAQGHVKIPLDTKQLVNGSYTIRATVSGMDLNGAGLGENFAPCDFVVRNGIAISNVSGAPNSFSPNGDGTRDTTAISYFLPSGGKVTVKVLDSSNNLVRTLKNGISDAPGDNSAEWDGKDESGQVKADGQYKYRIEAVDDSGNAATPAEGTVAVDNHLIRLATPVPGTNIQGVVTLDFALSGYYNAFSDNTVMYRVKGGYARNALGTCSMKTNGHMTIDWDTTKIANGEYDIIAGGVSQDYGGNWRYEEIIFNLTVNNPGPDIKNLKAFLNPFSPDGSGTWVDPNTGTVYNDPAPGLVLDDITTISFEAAQSYFFDITINDSNNVPVRTLSQILIPDAQTHIVSVIWDGKADSGTVVKNGQYQAVVKAGSSVQTTGITVDKKPFITKAQAAPNPISPDGDGIADTATISYSLSENSHVNISVLAGDTVVKSLVSNQSQSYGDYSFVWDGKDDSGTVVTSGKYQIKIEAAAETGNHADPVTLDVMVSYISNVRVSSDNVNPYKGETVTVTYQLKSDAIIGVKFYQRDGTLVRTLAPQALSPGEHSFDWDGKDDSGNALVDGACYFVIEDSMGGTTRTVYDPRGTGSRDISKSTAFTVSPFNAKLKQFCTLNYSLPEASRVLLKLRYDRYTGPALKVIKNYEATPSGAHTIIWDGCDEAGNILPYANYTFALWAYSLEKSAIIVVGGVPAVNNLQMTPLNFSPYRSQYSSSDAKNEGTITFELSRDANVTISVFDNSGNPVKVIANDAACSQGPNTFIWNGKDDAGNFLANGLYEILVQARSGTGYSDPLTLHSEIYY